MIGAVKAPQLLNLRLTTEEDASIKNTTSTSGIAHDDVDVELDVDVDVLVAVVVVCVVVVTVVVLVLLLVVEEVLVELVVVVEDVSGQHWLDRTVCTKSSTAPGLLINPSRLPALPDTIGITVPDTVFNAVLMVELQPTSYAQRKIDGEL